MVQRFFTLFLAITLFTTTLVATSSVWHPSLADDTQKVIRIASPPSGWPPFLIPPGNEVNQSGIMLDVMREVATKSGYAIQMSFYPEKRSRLLLFEGGIDAYPKAKEWVETPGNYLWTNPIVISRDVLIFRQTNPIHFETVRDLGGLNIGVIHGFQYPALEKDFNSGTIKRHEAKNTKSILGMVLRGHIDAAVTNRHVADWLIRNNKELINEDFSFSSQSIDSAPYRFAFSRKPCWEEFIEQFNQELSRMKKDGRLEAIFARYR